jgi:hypothetical protein
MMQRERPKCPPNHGVMIGETGEIARKYLVGALEMSERSRIIASHHMRVDEAQKQ